MHAIAPTIKPDDSGNQVANLQAALLFLLDRDVNLFFDPQKTPTADELKAITEALLVEAAAKLFDKTTRALTLAFQQWQGLPPQLKGVVDQTTADALNDRLRELGALDGDNTIAVKGHVLRQAPTSLARTCGCKVLPLLFASGRRPTMTPTYGLCSTTAPKPYLRPIPAPTRSKRFGSFCFSRQHRSEARVMHG